MEEEKTKEQIEEQLKKKLSNRNLKIYEEELQRIEEKNKGILTPKEVLEEAENKKNPLHKYFTWDNTEAGLKWRIWEARFLLRTITVKVMFEGTEKEYRKYVNVRLNEKESESNRGYVNTSLIFERPDFKEEVLSKAIKEAEYWKNKYNEYSELEQIFNSIDKTKKKLKSKLK